MRSAPAGAEEEVTRTLGVWVGSASKRAQAQPRDDPDAAKELPAVDRVALRDLPRAALLGVVDLVDIVSYEKQTGPGACGHNGDTFDLAADPWATGPFCWIVRNPRALPEPVPRQGRQGLWRVDTAEVPGLADVLG